jgi:hypothetical protein
MKATRLSLLLTAVTLSAAVTLGCGEDTGDDVGGDRTPPDVAVFDPQEGGTWTAGAPIRVTFTEPVSSSSVASGVRIIGASITVQYDEATLTATVTPTTDLEPGASYTVVVQGVEDISGNAMSEVRSASFTVASE